MGRLIDEDALIETLTKYKFGLISNDTEREYVKETVLNFVKEQPTAYDFKQVNNGWILCSERFPNKETKYLVCLESGEVKISEYETFLDRNGYLVHAWKRCLKHKVIAWQPLPEPYKEPERVDRN